jgi:hypothetical protein
MARHPALLADAPTRFEAGHRPLSRMKRHISFINEAIQRFKSPGRSCDLEP